MPVVEPLVQIALKWILVATDFSEWSKRALLAGLGIAQRYGAKVHVVNMVPSEGYGVAGAGMLGAVNFARHNARDLESEFLQKGFRADFPLNSFNGLRRDWLHHPKKIYPLHALPFELLGDLRALLPFSQRVRAAQDLTDIRGR